MIILTYELNSGRIIASESGPQIFVADKLLDNNTATLPDDAFLGLEFHYVNNDEVKIRPTQQTTLSSSSISANGIDAIVLQHLPFPCTVTVVNTVYEVDDGTLEITFDTPGEYPVTITAFPYLDKTFTVEAL